MIAGTVNTALISPLKFTELIFFFINTESYTKVKELDTRKGNNRKESSVPSGGSDDISTLKINLTGS